MKLVNPQVVELRPAKPWVTQQEAEDMETVYAFERALRDPIRRAQISQWRQEWRDSRLPAFLRRQAS